MERIIVQGDGTLQKGVARESNQTDSVAVQMVDKIVHGKFCASETVGFDIGSQHAARGVHGKDDFNAAPFHFLPAETGLRPRQRDAEAADGGKEKPPFPVSPCRGEGRGKLLMQVRRRESYERRTLTEVVTPPSPYQCYNCRQPGQQPERFGESHGNLR